MTDKGVTELRIKNMVCSRCELVVQSTLEELGLEVTDVELGTAVVENFGISSHETVDNALKEYGFELLEEKNQKLVERIKVVLIQYVQEIEKEAKVPNVSDYLTGHLRQHYAALSATFSKAGGITIEQYVIRLKIERVRELLSYRELTLSAIAHKLSYSSVAHLSNQFKQIIGMSVTDFKKAEDSFRQPLDEI
jgi:AraC-like DNA-binding protein